MMGCRGEEKDSGGEKRKDARSEGNAKIDSGMGGRGRGGRKGRRQI